MDRVIDGDDFYMAMNQKQELDEVRGARFYKYMSDCIDYERKRIGGNWVIAQAVPSRNMRDIIRNVLGKDLVFILLRFLLSTLFFSKLSLGGIQKYVDHLFPIKKVFFRNQIQIHSGHFIYSYLPNIGAGPYNRAGWNFSSIQ